MLHWTRLTALKHCLAQLAATNPWHGRAGLRQRMSWYLRDMIGVVPSENERVQTHMPGVSVVSGRSRNRWPLPTPCTPSRAPRLSAWTASTTLQLSLTTRWLKKYPPCDYPTTLRMAPRNHSRNCKNACASQAFELERQADFEQFTRECRAYTWPNRTYITLDEWFPDGPKHLKMGIYSVG